MKDIPLRKQSLKSPFFNSYRSVKDVKFEFLFVDAVSIIVSTIWKTSTYMKKLPFYQSLLCIFLTLRTTFKNISDILWFESRVYTQSSRKCCICFDKLCIYRFFFQHILHKIGILHWLVINTCSTDNKHFFKLFLGIQS